MLRAGDASVALDAGGEDAAPVYARDLGIDPEPLVDDDRLDARREATAVNARHRLTSTTRLVVSPLLAHSPTLPSADESAVTRLLFSGGILLSGLPPASGGRSSAATCPCISRIGRFTLARPDLNVPASSRGPGGVVSVPGSGLSARSSRTREPAGWTEFPQAFARRPPTDSPAYNFSLNSVKKVSLSASEQRGHTPRASACLLKIARKG